MELSDHRPAAVFGTVAVLIWSVWLGVIPAQAQPVLNEGFGGQTLPANWVVINNSLFANPGQEATWQRPPPPYGDPTGNDFLPPAHIPGPAPEPNGAYVGVGFDSTIGTNPAVVSNWLITPALQLTRDATMTFFTRTLNVNINGDRLQVWFSRTGGTSIGPNPVQGTPNITPGDQITPNNGDFADKLLDINPGEVATGRPGAYPEAWTPFTVALNTLTGLPTGTFTGRFGFRYYAEDGGQGATDRPANTNEPFTNFIGVDTVTVDAVPEPTSLALGGVAVPALAWVIRRRRGKAKR
jgi:hypothetical protein